MLDRERVRAQIQGRKVRRGPHPFTEDELKRFGRDIRRAVVGIGEQCKTSLRAITDRYLPLISAKRFEEGDSRFPRSVVRSVRDHDRSINSRFGDLLCFHIGNAILAFYDAVDGEDTEHVRARIEHLIEINTVGVDQFVVYGDDLRGFMLVNKDADASQKEIRVELPDPEKTERRGDDDAGGGGREAGVEGVH